MIIAQHVGDITMKIYRFTETIAAFDRISGKTITVAENSIWDALASSKVFTYLRLVNVPDVEIELLTSVLEQNAEEVM